MSPHLPPGTDLADGKYRVIRLLGTGGMGAVYEAENTTTHKRVAIKCLRPGREPDDVDGARLIREAKASARIRHPNVVDVYDVVRSDGFVGLVMEYLEGEPLSALLARGRLPVADALSLLVPIMRGVAAAHRQGVIHRDIKPANILLAREEDAPAPVPKLLDFGVSKLGGTGVDSLVLTRSGQIIGTPLYMSLEQFMGDKDLDARADVYSLGVLLYEALTGQPPFCAESLPELIIKLSSTSAIPPHAVCPDIPRALSELVLRTLAREREQRTSSVETLLRELAPFAGAAHAEASDRHTQSQPAFADAANVRQSAPPQPLLSTHDGKRGPRTTKRRTIAGGVALLLCLAGSALVLLDGPSPSSVHANRPTSTLPALPAALPPSPSVAATARATTATPLATLPLSLRDASTLPPSQPPSAATPDADRSEASASLRRAQAIARRARRGHQDAPAAEPPARRPSTPQPESPVAPPTGPRETPRIRVPDSTEF